MVNFADLLADIDGALTKTLAELVADGATLGSTSLCAELDRHIAAASDQARAEWLALPGVIQAQIDQSVRALASYTEWHERDLIRRALAL